ETAARHLDLGPEDQGKREATGAGMETDRREEVIVLLARRRPGRGRPPPPEEKVAAAPELRAAERRLQVGAAQVVPRADEQEARVEVRVRLLDRPTPRLRER